MQAGTPLIKICGLTRLQDAQSAVELGVTMLGFVCWKGSPRFIEPERIRDIVDRLPRSITAVGVFVNQPPEEIGLAADVAGLHRAQLHGDEPEAVWGRVARPVIKAVGVTPGFDWRLIAGWPAGVTPLLDAHDPIRRGGTGRRVDWRLAAGAARARPIILSGGLRPDNVRAAIETVWPWAVDVSSGVESSPGVKDAVLMRSFVEAVHRIASKVAE